MFSFKGSLLTSVLSYDLFRIVSGHHSVAELYLAELLSVVEEGVETAEAGAEDHEAPQEAADGDLGEDLGQGLGAGLPEDGH